MIVPRSFRPYALEAKYEFLQLARLPAYALPTLAFPVLFYLFFGVAMGHAEAGGTTLATYLLATYGAYGAVAAALYGFGISVATERGRGWLTLKRASPMPLAAYFLAKIANACAFSFAIVTMLTLLGVAFGGARIGIASWLALAIVLVLGCVPFCALGLAIGTNAGANAAPAIVNIVNLPLAMLGGLWMPLASLPPGLAHLAVWLPTYHYGQLALGAIGAGTGSPLVHVAVLLAYGASFAALAAFGWRRDEDRHDG